MKILKILVVFGLVSILGFGLKTLIKNNQFLEKRLEELSQRLETLETENLNLKNQIEYLENPENLLKKAKEHFNYLEEGEKLIIIIPEKEKDKEDKRP